MAFNNSGPDPPLYNATYYSLVAWFCAFKKGLGWFMQFCERFGLPKPVLHYDNPQDKESLIAQLNDNRVINAILLEGDRTVDWATVPASGQSLPQRELLSMAESACHKAILGQTLTTDVSKSGGSLAQAKVHAGVQADTVMRYAEYVIDIINTQLIPAIVHLNYGNADMPMPELRCKLPQAVANIERAQFWAEVLQIPGMQVVKSDIYESLGIAMPAQGDEVLSTPAPQENALEKAMQGFGQGKQDVETDKGRKDETALAARAKEDEPKGIAGWLAPLKKKLLEAKKNGASFDELKQMMLEAQLNTRALAGVMADNIRKGFYGDENEEELDAAKNEPKHERGCNQHECQPGCIVGNKGHIDNKQGVSGLIADNKQSNNAAINTQAEKIKEHIKKTEAGKIISKMLSEYLNRKQGEEPSNEKNIIDDVSPKTIKEALRIGGVDLTGYKIALIAANYHHAYKNHKHLQDDDIYLIPEIAKNWDSLEYQQKKNDADRLVFRKDIDSITYRLVAKIGSPKKELLLYVTTFFGEDLPNK